jgi:hypothetical protein
MQVTGAIMSSAARIGEIPDRCAVDKGNRTGVVPSPYFATAKVIAA